MLLSAAQIQTKDATALEAVKQSFAILRFHSAREIGDITKYCKKLLARILSDISKETCDATLFLDALAGEHQEILVPKLKSAYQDIKGDRSKVDLPSMEAMSDTILDLIRSRTGIIDEQLDVTASQSYLVAPYTNEPTFRDIEQALVLLQEIDDANAVIETQSELAGEEVAAVSAILRAKHKNLALDRVQKLRKLLAAHTAAEKILNACHVAKILRKQYDLQSEADIETFLQKDLDTLLSLSWSALERYYE